MEKYTKANIKAARSLALNIALMGGPDLTELPDNELVDRMFKMTASLSLAIRNVGVSAQEAVSGFALLADAMKKRNHNVRIQWAACQPTINLERINESKNKLKNRLRVVAPLQ